MHYLSTLGKTDPVDFKTALAMGLAPDGGLFVPEEIPTLSPETLHRLSGLELPQVAFELLAPYLLREIHEDQLRVLLDDALNFPIPTTPLHDDISMVELYHGPTLAFKDVAARVMARLTSALLPKEAHLTMLVATSGDTGSAVAHAYHNLPNIDVRILYPQGKVSPLQQKQLTTLGGNIVAYEVEGTFDDCQRMVKEAFRDPTLAHLDLTSANSINIGRLLPQMAYYAYAYRPFFNAGEKPLVAVPSGNFGNLTAGVFAQRMGLPIPHFLAANNRNDPVCDYLETGSYCARPSVHTLSNAMDIGDPSNFARLQWAYNGSLESMRQAISAVSVTDEETQVQIRETFQKSGKVIDPHTAVGVRGIQKYRQKTGDTRPFLVMATAHPSKFLETVEAAIGQAIELPPQLAKLKSIEGHAISIASTPSTLRRQLLGTE
jgi:threonine synthase